MEKAIRGEETKGHNVVSIKKLRQEGDRHKEITKNITRSLRFRAARTGGGRNPYISGKNEVSLCRPGGPGGQQPRGGGSVGKRNQIRRETHPSSRGSCAEPV